MKRITAIALVGWCLLAWSGSAQAQTLKERSLTDAPAPAPTQATTPAASQPVQQAPQAGAARVAPAQPATQPAPAPGYQQPAPQPNYAQPAPAPQPGAPAEPGYQQSAPPTGSTPINGQTSFSTPPPPPPPPPSPEKTYKREEINREVMGFFEGGSRGLAQLVARAFGDLGEPVGFIKGNEAGGALFVGLRYGAGSLFLKGYPPMPVFWQSPSLGIDLGVNAVKVFTLVYGMQRPEDVFRRFPGVDGSAYVIGGFGMNYQRSDGMTLAPIRFGVGLRLGANVGYQHYTRDQTINPF